MSLTAIDADGHVDEWHIDWPARFPAELRDRAHRVVKDERGLPRLRVDGIVLPNPTYEGEGRWVTGAIKPGAHPDGMRDPHARMPDMEKEGIDQAVLFGTAFAFHANSSVDWRLSAAATRAWNDWAAKEYCAAYPDRLFFAALLPIADIGAAVDEAQRVVKELGAVGLVLPVNFQDKNLDSPYFDRLYEAAQEMDVPICVHASTGSHSHVKTIGAHNNWLITHALAFPMGLTLALASVICGGVMVRYPRLKIAFFEGGVGWLPFYMDRLDEHVEKLPSLAPWLEAPPSEYIKSDRFFISCESEEDLGPTLDAIGDDHIIYASDYAHWDCDFPNSVRAFSERDSLTETQKRKILRDNAGRLYKLPVLAATSTST